MHIHPGQQMPAGHHPAKPLERMQDGVLYQKINRAAFYSPGVRTGPSPHSLLKKLPGKIGMPKDMFCVGRNMCIGLTAHV